MKNPNSIKNWSFDDKPREKLINKGAKQLSNSELLAILIESGTKEFSALHLAKLILKESNNNLKFLIQKESQELQQFHGIGIAKATKLMACFELARRIDFQAETILQKIHSSKEAFLQFSPHLSGLKHEEFWVIFLNQANGIIIIENLSKGGITSTVVDLKILFNRALLNKATALIIGHNHPSGNLSPSEQDLQLTKDISQAAKLLQFSLLDHLIISDKQYLSMADEGMI